MLKTLFITLAILAFTSQAAFRASDISTKLRESEINGRTILLNYVTGGGFSLPAFFATTYPQARNILLSLYSSDLLLTYDCFNFDTYDCSQFANCTFNKTGIPVAYPYFTAVTDSADAITIVDSDIWAVAPAADVIIATSCSGPTTPLLPIGQSTYGILGLGLNKFAFQSFGNNINSFAVYFWNKNFRLEFNPISSFNNISIGVISADQNWQIPNVPSMTIGNRVNPLTGFRAIFDINSETIALPEKLFNQTIETFPNYTVVCPFNFYRPACTFTPNQVLPNITFDIDVTTKILLTPEMYALNLDSTRGQFTLNFRAINSNLDGINYVTPAYATSIILGVPFLANYYTVFDFKSISAPQVSLFWKRS